MKSRLLFLIFRVLQYLNAASPGVDLRLWTLDFGPWTLDFGLWTLDFGLWTLDFGPRTKMLTLNTKIRTLNTKTGTLDTKIRTLNTKIRTTIFVNLLQTRFLSKSTFSNTQKSPAHTRKSLITNHQPQTKSSPPYEGGVAAASADGVVLSFQPQTTDHQSCKPIPIYIESSLT